MSELQEWEGKAGLANLDVIQRKLDLLFGGNVGVMLEVLANVLGVSADGLVVGKFSMVGHVGTRVALIAHK